MRTSPFSFHELHINNTKTIQKPKKNFSKIKTSILTTLYSYHNFVQKWRCFSRSQTPPYILTIRKQLKKLLKTYPPHGSPNNQKKTKSHGSPCDSPINHKEQHHMVPHVIPQLITRKQHHMVSPCDSTINHKQTTSHDSPCDSIINHKQTTSHGFPMWFHN
jgi:hypothetical protein